MSEGESQEKSSYTCTYDVLSKCLLYALFFLFFRIYICLLFRKTKSILLSHTLLQSLPGMLTLQLFLGTFFPIFSFTCCPLLMCVTKENLIVNAPPLSGVTALLPLCHCEKSSASFICHYSYT